MWAFNERRPCEDSTNNVGNELGNATEIIESLYAQLLEFDLTFSELYDMTIKELIKTLENRRKGLSYQMWKQAYLIGLAFSGKNFPQTPEKASKELYPRKPTLKINQNLMEKLRRNQNG